MTVVNTTTDLLSIRCYLSDSRVKLYLDVSIKDDQKDNLPDKRLLLEAIETQLCPVLEGAIDPERIDLGVLKDVIATLADGQRVEKRLICRGRPPGPARDGKIVFLVRRISRDKKVEVDTKGFADFRELHLFDNIEKEQCVARVYPPKPGADGENALGEVISGPVGNEVTFSTDASLRYLDWSNTGKSYGEVISCQEGYLLQDQDSLAVVSELQLSGDVDFSTGNIDFIGSVRVKGEVKPGFFLRGRKGVFVQGGVTGATVVASEGDVTIAGTVTGSSGGSITASGAVKVKSALEAAIDAGAGITIEKSSQRSSLRTRSSIQVERGPLVGGEAFTVCGLEAQEIGNESGVETRIFLCSDVEATPQYREVISSIDRHRKAIELLTMHLGPLATNQAAVAKLKGDMRKNVEQLLIKLKRINGSLEERLKRKRQLLEKATASSVVRVNFHKYFYPGVQVLFSSGVYQTLEALRGPASLELTEDRSDMTSSTLKPLECVLNIHVPATEKENE